MSYAFAHRDGWEEEDPPLSQLHDLLNELSEHEDDIEHGSVAVLYENSALEVYRTGEVLFTPDLEADVVEQLRLAPGTIDRETLLNAMNDLAKGRLDDVRALPWQLRSP